MQFKLVGDDTISIRSRDQELFFDVKSLKRSSLVEQGKDLFWEINDYISGLDHQTQAQIFNIYKEIREMRDDLIAVSFTTQQKDTTNLVKELYDLLDIEKMQIYLTKIKTEIVFPSDLMDRESQAAKNSNHNENINYFNDDYEGLVFLVFALRPMIPIWGEYIEMNRHSAGTSHREYLAFRLLERSRLYDCPQINRLRIYITEWRTTASYKRQLPADIAVLDGISSDSITDYLLSIILVRKVSITNINARGSSSIISSIYGYLKSKIAEASKVFATSPKYDESGGVEDENEISKLERYKISTKLTYGDIEFIKTYMKNPLAVAKELDDTIPQELINSCLENNHSMTLGFHRSQIKLAQWCISPIFPAMGVYELSKIELTNLFSVVQAALIHWELPDLALILTATIDDTQFPILSTTRAGLDPALLKQLEILYPYKEYTRTTVKRHNIAGDAIDDLGSDLLSKSFRVHPPECFTEKYGQCTASIDCPLTVINQLATAVLKANRSFNP